MRAAAAGQSPQAEALAPGPESRFQCGTAAHAPPGGFLARGTPFDRLAAAGALVSLRFESEMRAYLGRNLRIGHFVGGLDRVDPCIELGFDQALVQFALGLPWTKQ